jgi:hypothetical protein
MHGELTQDETQYLAMLAEITQIEIEQMEELV